MPSYSKNKGVFTPSHPEKYLGRNIKNITYKSTWELTVMNKLDAHPYILKWSSETTAIKYFHPLLKTVKNYVPDFFVNWIDRSGKQYAELWEIKPASENPWLHDVPQIKNSKARYRNELVKVINHAKWSEAIKFCAAHGYTFRVLTENDIFGNP